MSLNLVYGKQLQSNFLDAGEDIAKDVEQGKIFDTSKKLNHAFFGGGVFAPKSFAVMLSEDIPKKPCYIERTRDHSYITIQLSRSLSAKMGLIEGIPLIGSAIAAIKILYHLFGMLSSYSSLKRAVKHLNETERNDFNVGRGASCVFTSKVFAKAIKYTVHQNHLVGSLLSLIPFVKPIIRITQGVIFNVMVNKAIPSQG